MLATSLTAAVVGAEAHLIRVEADTSSGFPRFTMLGLPDSSIKESEGRIRAALRNCGFAFKWDRRITVSMAPASLRKMGSSYDLATAVGLLAADGALPAPNLRSLLLVGELALDGAVRPVTGLLPMMLMARRNGLDAALVPAANAAEAALVDGVAVYPIESLPQAVDLAAAAARPAPPPAGRRSPSRPAQPDMADVRGQAVARRGLEIAAAGGHNLLFVGPPGAGKTMLARRLPGLLPPLSLDEALETSAIHSAAGMTIDVLIAERPFRAPHHTASDVAVVGGGSLPRPGEVSLAHNGVLFLDELPEFRRNVLEALRQPLEERAVTIARSRATLRLPARFQLVAAMNPCPCGKAGQRDQGCACTPGAVDRYRRRVSGPLMDRIDLQVEVGPVTYGELTGARGEPSAVIRDRVLAARSRQEDRREATGGARVNAELEPAALRLTAQPDADGKALLAQAMEQRSLSGRAHDRVLRVARTLADLEGEAAVAARHIGEALHYRGVAPN